MHCNYEYTILGVDEAIEQYKLLCDINKYRLDNFDMYSHLLYVKRMKQELSELAQRAMEIDQNRPAACCIIGNYHSIQSDHTNAVIYFQRAVKLDPT